MCVLQELALPIIENEIFGEVAEAKEVAQFAMNYKEAKKVCGFRAWVCADGCAHARMGGGVLMFGKKRPFHLP